MVPMKPYFYPTFTPFANSTMDDAVEIDTIQMKGTGLVTLAFSGSIGMTLVILACALPKEKVWWPMIVILFYALAPIPTFMARRQTQQYGRNSYMDLAIFITMGFVVSSFALPIILSTKTAAVIEALACYLTLAGNVIIYVTYVGFFLTLYQDDSSYYIW